MKRLIEIDVPSSDVLVDVTTALAGIVGCDVLCVYEPPTAGDPDHPINRHTYGHKPNECPGCEPIPDVGMVCPEREARK